MKKTEAGLSDLLLCVITVFLRCHPGMFFKTCGEIALIAETQKG